MDEQTFPVVERDRYRVDGVISGEFVPDGAPPYEHEMQCFELTRWYALLPLKM